MFPTTILTALLLALTAAASPVVQARNSLTTLHFSRHVKTASTLNVIQNDRRRSKALKAQAKMINADKHTAQEAAIVNQRLEDKAVAYIASVGVGVPATFCMLLFQS